jgi:membrane protein DedA with SNARE-associated domain
MTETLFALVPQHGATVMFLATFFSCLALPIPSSLLMMAAGAFIASGDLAAAPILGAAFAGAVIGDQIGYGAGRMGGAGLWERLQRRRRSGPLMRQAKAMLHRRALTSVFLSRWLFSPLGPWVNLAAGATALDWRRFSLAGVAGEAVWVGAYVGLGFFFAAQVEELGATVGSGVGALAALAVAGLLARVIWRRRG